MTENSISSPLFTACGTHLQLLFRLQGGVKKHPPEGLISDLGEVSLVASQEADLQKYVL